MYKSELQCATVHDSPPCLVIEQHSPFAGKNVRTFYNFIGGNKEKRCWHLRREVAAVRLVYLRNDVYQCPTLANSRSFTSCWPTIRAEGGLGSEKDEADGIWMCHRRRRRVRGVLCLLLRLLRSLRTKSWSVLTRHVTRAQKIPNGRKRKTPFSVIPLTRLIV